MLPSACMAFRSAENAFVNIHHISSLQSTFHQPFQRVLLLEKVFAVIWAVRLEML